METQFQIDILWHCGVNVLQQESITDGDEVQHCLSNNTCAITCPPLYWYGLRNMLAFALGVFERRGEASTPAAQEMLGPVALDESSQAISCKRPGASGIECPATSASSQAHAGS